MQSKHNESCRHKIKKSRYKVTDWHGYKDGLRQRGDFTIWFTEEAMLTGTQPRQELEVDRRSILIS